jgi:hypothetical protein
MSVRINFADVDELCSIPGVSDQMAARIVAYRFNEGFLNKKTFREVIGTDVTQQMLDGIDFSEKDEVSDDFINDSFKARQMQKNEIERISSVISEKAGTLSGPPSSHPYGTRSKTLKTSQSVDKLQSYEQEPIPQQIPQVIPVSSNTGTPFFHGVQSPSWVGG